MASLTDLELEAIHSQYPPGQASVTGCRDRRQRRTATRPRRGQTAQHASTSLSPDPHIAGRLERPLRRARAPPTRHAHDTAMRRTPPVGPASKRQSPGLPARHPSKALRGALAAVERRATGRALCLARRDTKRPRMNSWERPRRRGENRTLANRASSADRRRTADLRTRTRRNRPRSTPAVDGARRSPGGRAPCPTRRGQIRTAVSAQRPCRRPGPDPSTMFHHTWSPPLPAQSPARSRDRAANHHLAIPQAIARGQ